MDPQYLIGKSVLAMYSPVWGSRPGEENVPGPATSAGGSVRAREAAAPDTNASESSDKLYAAGLSKRGRGPEAVAGDFTFDDFLDIINPLQHIPIVNLIYREATGDKISGAAQIIGSAIIGGPLGMISGVVSAILEQETGKGIGETAVAMLTGIGRDEENIDAPTEEPASATMVAEANPEEPAADEAPQAVAIAENEEENEAAAVDATAVAEAPAAAVPAAETKTANGEMISPVADPAAPPQAAVQTAALAPTGSFRETARVEGGPRFYPLDKVHRLNAANAPRMPVGDTPDVRLKPINRQRISRPSSVLAGPVSPAFLPDIPLVSKQQAEQILNLDATPKDSIAASALPPGFNPLPPQLIQDMMLMNLEKYKNSGGSFDAFTRGSSVDIEG